MLRFRDGDAHAFDRLYERHKGPLFRYCLRHLNERATAEETFQDVWIRVIGARERYRPSAKFSTWLYRIAHNRVIDHYRAANPGQRVSIDDEPASAEPRAPETSDPGRRVASERASGRLNAALAELPSEQRDAFLLHEEAGLGLEDIARIAGVGRETVKSRLRYALKKLRTALRDEL